LSIEITIDGKKVTGKSDQTILEVSKANGIHIPTLCHHSKLPANGACRICVVDVGKPDRLEAACTTPIGKGMVVETNNERVLSARRTNVELLLSHHRSNCLTCEQDGNCALQDIAYEMGIDMNRLPFLPHDVDRPIDDSSPALLKDPNLCILCGRCVSACNNITNHDILSYERRGYDTMVVAGLGELIVDSGCVSCGECVQVCPTGALIDKPSRFKGRWKDLSVVKTTCPFCGVGCTLDLYVKNNQIVRIRGTDNGVENEGSLCVKGRFGYEWVGSPDRLTTPLIKINGELHPVSWGEAIDLIASKLREIKTLYGGDAIAGLGSAKCTNEENYIFQKFIRVALETNNVDACCRLCHAPTVEGLSKAFGSGAMTNSIMEMLDTDCFLVTGSNTTENHPVIANYIKKAVVDRGAKLIIADPRKIDLVRHSDIWLRQRGGTDVAMLNGLMNIILQEGLHDEEFIRVRCEHFDEFKKTVEKYTPERVEKITGIAKEKLREAAIMFAEASKASIIFCMGITQHSTGTDNVLSIANLAMLTGNVGKPSTGVNPLRGQNNVQGICDVGTLPNTYPGYQAVNNPEVKKKFEEAWMVKLNDKVGLTAVEMMNAAKEGKLKAMYIMGDNPMVSNPDLNNVKESLEKLDFLVVQDIFLTETARLADVVLPACCFAEKDGTFTNTARRVQRVRKAVEAPGMSRLDWEIICDIACRMGYKMLYSSAAEIMDEIAKITTIYGGISYNRLKGKGLQWPCPTKDHLGTPYLHKDKFSRGLGRFHAIEYKPPVEEPDAEYPMILTTGRVLQHFHTGTMTRRSKVLNILVPKCLVEINPADARRLRIVDGDDVKVSSRRGTIISTAKVTDRSAIGSVFIPFHFVEAAANILTNPVLDPISKIPELKVCAVKVEKV
jgi:formate dehydrogenase alpha subunit